MQGTTLAHYRMDQRIGAGGMGVVFRAHDVRLRRDVALKVLPAGKDADANARARLLREARLASSLNHPHICHIYEVGQADGHDYIAMELVQGRSVRDLVPAGGLPGEAVIRYASEIADALAHAHEHGVVHRDLKSDNVMITPGDRAKVLDFGLAKRVEIERNSLATTDPALSQPGTVAGTPHATAPEVLRGAPADARSDLWSLGVLMYEMASGTLPFTGQTRAELFSAILNDEAAALPSRVPAGLRAVIGRCMAKEPARRYRSAREVQASLETLLAHPHARPGAGAPRRVVWLAISGLSLTALAALLAFDVGGLRGRLGPPGGSASGASPIRSLAVLPLENLSGDAAQDYFADGMTEELITNLASIQSLKVISRTSVMRFKRTRQSIPEIARELGVDGIVEGSVMRAAERVRITAQLIDGSTDRHLWAQSFERDLRDVLRLQREVAREIAAKIDLRLSPQENTRLHDARTVNPEANDLYLMGRRHWDQMSDADVRQAITLFERAIAIDPSDARFHSGHADAYLFLALVVGTVGFHEALPRVESSAARALALDEASPEAHVTMGMALLWGRWDWAGAERHILRAMELNPGLDGPHLAYATWLGARGRSEEAIAAARRGYEINPLSQIASYGLARELFQGRRYDDALAQAGRTLEIEPGSVFGHILTARILEQMGRLPEAITEQAALVSPTEVEALRTALAREGERGYWRACLELTRRERAGGRRSTTWLACLYSKLGDEDRAYQSLELALDRREGDCLFLGSSPIYEDLRRDPRFASVAKRLGWEPPGTGIRP
jgi:serine/threonine-protein kinase